MTLEQLNLLESKIRLGAEVRYDLVKNDTAFFVEEEAILIEGYYRPQESPYNGVWYDGTKTAANTEITGQEDIKGILLEYIRYEREFLNGTLLQS